MELREKSGIPEEEVRKRNGYMRRREERVGSLKS